MLEGAIAWQSPPEGDRVVKMWQSSTLVNLSDKFAGYGSEDEFDSCSEWDDDEAVDRAKEWLGWSPIDREASSDRSAGT